MVRFRNTDNGMVLEVPEGSPWATQYARAINMERLDGSEPLVEPLEEMTIRELRAYAEEHDINLHGATREADVLHVILSAEEE